MLSTVISMFSLFGQKTKPNAGVQASFFNGFNWWKSRDDVGGVVRQLRYYNGHVGRRWRLEGPEYSLFGFNSTVELS